MNISCSLLLQRACLFSLIIRKAILSSYWYGIDDTGPGLLIGQGL